MVIFGYARVSTFDQNLDLQKDALEKAGCEKIFVDQASGAKTDRPGLSELFAKLRRGDTLVVWKLDRLGRSMQHLIENVNKCPSINGILRPSSAFSLGRNPRRSAATPAVSTSLRWPYLNHNLPFLDGHYLEASIS